VVTCAPNFPEGRVHAGYSNRWHQREVVEGIDVVRVKTFIAKNEGFALRTLDYLSFMVGGFFAGLAQARPDVIVAGPGPNRIFGARGNDVICGGHGRDRIEGGRGKDPIDGKKDADLVHGGRGSDEVDGGAGRDNGSAQLGGRMFSQPGLVGFGLSLLFSILLCVHVVRTGREMFWLFIILIFQPIGGLVYFVANATLFYTPPPV
jgi:Ca2+-binding RTX toxin-like protein